MQNPILTDYQFVGDLPSLGSTILTEMARRFEQYPSDDMSFLFSSQSINERAIVIERVRQGLGITPLVQAGQPDAITNSATVDRRVVVPALCRESDYIPQDVINNLRQVGTFNEKVGKEFVVDRTRRLVDRNNHLWSVLRHMALLGGINYTDPRTNVSINVNMQIPSGNFRSLTGLGSTRTWDAKATATPINDTVLFKQYLYKVAKTKPTHMIMRSDLLTLLNINKEVLTRVESPGAPNAAGFVEYREGQLYAIAGLKILIADTLYEDPTDGVEKHVWPLHKVGVVCARHMAAPGETLGRMTYCVGEDPNGKPGLWMRTSPDTTVPSAPGRGIQIGNAGLPWLKYPDWVGILTVGDETAIANQIANAV